MQKITSKLYRQSTVEVICLDAYKTAGVETFREILLSINCYIFFYWKKKQLFKLNTYAKLCSPPEQSICPSDS